MVVYFGHSKRGRNTGQIYSGSYTKVGSQMLSTVQQLLWVAALSHLPHFFCILLHTPFPLHHPSAVLSSSLHLFPFTVRWSGSTSSGQQSSHCAMCPWPPQLQSCSSRRLACSLLLYHHPHQLTLGERNCSIWFHLTLGGLVVVSNEVTHCTRWGHDITLAF